MSVIKKIITLYFPIVWSTKIHLLSFFYYSIWFFFFPTTHLFIESTPAIIHTKFANIEFFKLYIYIY